MRDGGFIATRENRGRFGGPDLMLQSQSDGRTGPPRGTSTNRVDDHQDGTAARRQQTIHIGRRPRLFDAVTGKVGAHRSD